VDLERGEQALGAVALVLVLAAGRLGGRGVRGFLLSVLLVAAVRSGRSPVGAVIVSANVFGLLHLVSLVDGSLRPSVLGQVM
jgi:hypothetical protein